MTKCYCNQTGNLFLFLLRNINGSVGKSKACYAKGKIVYLFGPWLVKMS